MSVVTKFRAFQLDSEGSLFSFYKNNHYTLIEARLPKGGLDILRKDLQIHGKSTIDTLHITSWDADHCTYDDLVQILNHLRPALIEVPDYKPDSNDAQLCRRIIFKYDDIHQRYVNNVQPISAAYISSLTTAGPRETPNVIYPSSYNCDNKNDMSLIKLFRSAGFNVLSLGDCESEDIANRLIRSSLIKTEVDVLILPHHGANNGFTSGNLLDAIKPKLAVCSSNFGNQYEHPRPEVCQMLSCRNIPLMTTKRGDVFVYQESGSIQAKAVSLISDNNATEKSLAFTPKRYN